ncbi:hypothetical protein LTR66_009354 [Elasticomyces elasticus]|nr:hypothetical protein LTR66_009354 [Elasticomyces elasticus]KAK4988113.1 hypothetical protein LTR50_004135 [Elasticomyces elasticus]
MPSVIYVYGGVSQPLCGLLGQDHTLMVVDHAGHNDFLKALLCVTVAGKELLISGGADAVIIVWEIATGMKLHTLKGHARGIQDLAVDPLSLPAEGGIVANEITFFSAGSERDIRCWRLTADSAVETDESAADPIFAHETSVYRLVFDSEGDLWTASADKTAKHLVRTRSWEADTVLQHPDFVRDIKLSNDERWVVTACRDEEVRVWDAGSGELYHVYSGHYEEVTGLLVLGRGDGVVSVSIDGTVRRWSLQQQDLTKARLDAEKAEQGLLEEKVEAGEKSLLTAEEEAELAELMDEDD